MEVRYIRYYRKRKVFSFSGNGLGPDNLDHGLFIVHLISYHSYKTCFCLFLNVYPSKNFFLQPFHVPIKVTGQYTIYISYDNLFLYARYVMVTSSDSSRPP
ncbi:unnamed protein product [Lupinus luteus]|uniref:Uncharacterized protein n=1 Tax=Lupinus luteus TaxID=3873 RepID=A0AAV1YHR9_LUPLU